MFEERFQGIQNVRLKEKTGDFQLLFTVEKLIDTCALCSFLVSIVLCMLKLGFKQVVESQISTLKR